MKAVIAKGYGKPEVLTIQEIETPQIKKNEVLIKVKTASLNSGDVRMRSLDAGPGLKGFISKFIIRLLLGVTKPKHTPGSVLAGEIAEVGDDVISFKVGDEVYAMTGMQFGAFAEYCVLPMTAAIALKPQKASFEEACSIPFGGNTALYFLHKAGIARGKKIFINGSTGAVGTSAVQIAKQIGGEVTAVSGPDGIELTKQLGATTVYNYKKTPIEQITGSFDIIFDAVGKTSKKATAHLMAENAQYITVAGFDVATGNSPNLEELAQMYDDGKLKAIIDKIFTLEEIVEANHYVDSGRKKGNVVIKISP